MAIVKGGAKVIQALKKPGQTLADIKKEWDELSTAEQERLVEYAKAEGIA